uniref:Putative secreted protein n=1 Tax=Anopheles darlingi TaxID=43151 RepID=A0A2M4D938_ANODA
MMMMMTRTLRKRSRRWSKMTSIWMVLPRVRFTLAIMSPICDATPPRCPVITSNLLTRSLCSSMGQRSVKPKSLPSRVRTMVTGPFRPTLYTRKRMRSC